MISPRDTITAAIKAAVEGNVASFYPCECDEHESGYDHFVAKLSTALAAGGYRGRDEALAVFAALADEWDQRADRANVEMAAGAIHGCAAELRQTLRDHQEER